MKHLTINFFSPTCYATCYSVGFGKASECRQTCFTAIDLYGKRGNISPLILGGDIPEIKPLNVPGTDRAYYGFTIFVKIDTRT